MRLAAISFAFLSLGLPTILLGSAWPVMHRTFATPMERAGFVNIVIVGSMIASSFFAARLIRRFGTFRVLSIGMTVHAVALAAAAAAPSFAAFCAMMTVFGIASGTVNTAANTHIAVHESSQRMSLMHLVWGLGVIIGGGFISLTLAHSNNWRLGYAAIAVCVFAMTAFVARTRKVWPDADNPDGSDDGTASEGLSFTKFLTMPGLLTTVLFTFCFCSVEACADIWASSWMVKTLNAAPNFAASATTLYFVGEMIGRLVAGVVSVRFSDRILIRAGLVIALVGAAIMLAPSQWLAAAGLFTLGFGSSPVFPAILHQLPERFGKSNTSAAVSLTLSTNFLSCAVQPSVFGMLVASGSLALFPWFVLISLAMLVFCTIYKQ